MNYTNIEKSAFRKGEYIGYANGVWRITKSNSSYGNWCAVFRDSNRVAPIFAFRLSELSKKLIEFALKKYSFEAR